MSVLPPIRLAVLGSTGSIGLSTLDVAARHPERFDVVALGAGRNVARLREQCLRFRPRYAALADVDAARELEAELARAGLATRVLAGADALSALASGPEVDVVMAAVVGAAGLPSTLAAARAGKRILLANKESLVMAGPLLLDAVRAAGAVLLPIDSEHNAIFQCLPHGSSVGNPPVGVRRLLLTASGGPFRDFTGDLSVVTPEQACAHPNWSMGRKISVDSATLMNKGLELIEACLLFGLPPDRIDVVVHPQSIIHSMVEYLDGSVLAQLGSPDMRTPIAHALAWPQRVDAGVQSLDLVTLGRLDFRAPDTVRFPCLALAIEAARLGGTAPAALNAANEVAVSAFLERRLNFTDIAAVIDTVMNESAHGPAVDLEAVLATDAAARRLAAAAVARWAGAAA
ncbi:MAG: 1-deoxy-D-xylulose 5-phosphate reductoisomerase [Pseudomonadota bacterium]